MTRVGLIFVTIDRPDAAMRLIESVSRFHPEIQVYVVEQLREQSPLAERCRDLGYRHQIAPYDSGVSYCRNLAVRLVEEAFFFLADDDFILQKPVEYGLALTAFEERPSLLMVGGDLDELDETQARRPAILLQRGRHILLDSVGRGLLLCSTVFLDTSSFQLAGETFFKCDMVAQWALCRTSLFRSRDLRWDECFKNNGEHIDFFLTLKIKHPDLEILYWPNMRCAHDPRRSDDYARLRTREDWQPIFSEKWQIDYIGNLGGQVRRFREKLAIGHDPSTKRAGQSRDFEKLKEIVARQRDTIARKTERIDKLEKRVQMLVSR